MANILDLKKSAEEEAPKTEPIDQPLAVVDGGIDDGETLTWETGDALTERGWRRHYMAMGAVGIALAAVAVWQASILIGLVGIAGLAAWEVSERFRMPFAVRLHGRGITVNDHTYPHADLASFDVHETEDGLAHLSVRTNLRRMPRLRLPLGETDPALVRQFLSLHVPEEEHPEPLYEWWLRN
jgi:hypothetical protein